MLKDNTLWPSGFYLRNARVVQHTKINVIYINRTKGKIIHTIMSADAKKAFDRSQFNPKGNPSWILRGRTDAEAPVLWSPDAKSQLTRKDPDAGKDWRQEEEGMTEDEMAGWHHWLNGHEFEQALRDGVTVPGVAKSDTTEQLNSNNDLINHSYNEVFIKPSKDGVQRASQLMSPWRCGDSSILGRA